MKFNFSSTNKELTFLYVSIFKTAELLSSKYKFISLRNTKKETFYQIRQTFQMMTFHSVHKPEEKLSAKILESSISKRKHKTTNIKKYPNPFGSLHGYLNKKILTKINHRKMWCLLKPIKILRLVKIQTRRQHWRKLRSKFMRANRLQNSLCFIYLCAKVLWRKRRNVKTSWLNFIKGAFHTKSLSRTHQNTWATHSWLWRSMTVCIHGSWESLYWHVVWPMEKNFLLLWLMTWLETSSPSQSLSHILRDKTWPK